MDEEGELGEDLHLKSELSPRFLVGCLSWLVLGLQEERGSFGARGVLNFGGLKCLRGQLGGNVR